MTSSLCILIYFNTFVDEVKRKAQDNIDTNNREKQRQVRKNLEKNDAATVIQSRMYKNYNLSSIINSREYCT